MRKTCLSLVLLLMAATVYGAKPLTGGPLPSADDYSVLSGQVTVGTIDAHTIGVIVNDGGPYRHIFRFWSNSLVKPFRVTSENASVEFRGDELIVMASDQEWFYALVTTAGDSHAPRQPVGFTAARYVGYGLNHEIRPFAVKQPATGRHITALDDCADYGLCLDNLDYGIGGGGGGGTCDSGGVGSTSCSTSNSHGSCSVTCMNGSYACCTNATTTANANCRCKF